MHNPTLVGVFERFGDLPRDEQGFGKRYRAPGDAFGQRRALDQLHHQCLVFHAVDGCDVGMVERGQHLSFPREAGKSVRVLGEGVGQNLDRHFASELGIGGAPDLAHPTFAQLGGDSVVGDGLLRTHSSLPQLRNGHDLITSCAVNRRK
jgi:hypothetical protein